VAAVKFDVGQCLGLHFQETTPMTQTGHGFQLLELGKERVFLQLEIHSAAIHMAVDENVKVLQLVARH